MPANKIVNIQIELTPKGYISAVYAGNLPADYVLKLLESAAASMSISVEHNLPFDTTLEAAKYILDGGCLPGDMGEHE